MSRRCFGKLKQWRDNAMQPGNLLDGYRAITFAATLFSRLLWKR